LTVSATSSGVAGLHVVVFQCVRSPEAEMYDFSQLEHVNGR
jgi:hypothetical protein